MSEETKNTSEAVNDTAKDSESAKKPKKAKNAELEKALAELENSKDMLLRTAAEVFFVSSDIFIPPYRIVTHL